LPGQFAYRELALVPLAAALFVFLLYQRFSLQISFLAIPLRIVLDAVATLFEARFVYMDAKRLAKTQNSPSLLLPLSPTTQCLHLPLSEDAVNYEIMLTDACKFCECIVLGTSALFSRVCARMVSITRSLTLTSDGPQTKGYLLHASAFDLSQKAHGSVTTVAAGSPLRVALNQAQHHIELPSP